MGFICRAAESEGFRYPPHQASSVTEVCCSEGFKRLIPLTRLSRYRFSCYIGTSPPTAISCGLALSPSRADFRSSLHHPASLGVYRQ